MKWIVLVVLATGCFASRRSIDYECATQKDCSADRVCTQGYCVIGDPANGCPAVCSSCSTSKMTCEIDCNSNTDCAGVVQCPSGYDCTIQCNAANACKGIDCSVASACTVSCNTVNACTTVIACGAGTCDITCNARNACPQINCASSCACDVACDLTDPDCGQESCPTRGGISCTSNGAPGSTCSSTMATCNTCP